MAEEEDVIQHLVQIEKEASETLMEAQRQADTILAEARAKSESQFKEKYAAIAQDLEQRHEEQKKIVLVNHEKLVAEYKQNLEDNQKDYGSFNELLEKKLFGTGR